MIAGFRLVLKAVTKDVMEEFRSLKEDIYLNSTASETRIDSKFKEIAGNLTKLNKEPGGITNNIGVLVEINVRSSLLNQNYSESYLCGEKLNSLYDLAKNFVAGWSQLIIPNHLQNAFNINWLMELQMRSSMQH